MSDPTPPSNSPADPPAAAPSHLPPEPTTSTTRDLNVGVIAVISILSVMILFVIVTGTQAWYRLEVNQEHKVKVIDQPFFELNAQNNKELIRIHHDKWTDRDKGIAQVPIERAMELVADRYAKSASNQSSASPGSGRAGGEAVPNQTSSSGQTPPPAGAASGP